MMSLLHKTHLKDRFIGDFYGLGVDMKSMQAFAVTVRDVAFDSWKVVGDNECEVQNQACFGELTPQLFLVEVVADRRVDHACSLSSQWKNVIYHDFSKIECTTFEKLLLTTGMTPVETPLVDHIGL